MLTNPRDAFRGQSRSPNYPAEGVPLGIEYRSMVSKNKSDGATEPNKKFDNIFSRVNTIHQRDRRTEGHRTTAKTTLTHSIARVVKYTMDENVTIHSRKLVISTTTAYAQ